MLGSFLVGGNRLQAAARGFLTRAGSHPYRSLCQAPVIPPGPNFHQANVLWQPGYRLCGSGQFTRRFLRN